MESWRTGARLMLPLWCCACLMLQATCARQGQSAPRSRRARNKASPAPAERRRRDNARETPAAKDGPRWVELYGVHYNGAGPYHGQEWIHYSDPDRDLVAFPDRFLRLLELKGGETVADVGSGSGYFTFRIARAVGPKGKVFALELKPPGGPDPFYEGMMGYFDRHLHDRRHNPHDNVVPVRDHPDDAMLPPASVDVALMYQVSCLLRTREDLLKTGDRSLLFIHHEQTDMLKSVFRSLKPGGRLVVVDLVDDPDVPGARDMLWPWSPMAATLHMAARVGDVRRNYEQIGLRFVRDSDIYMNDAYKRARARFVRTPWHEAMVSYGIAHRMFVLVFEKPSS